MENKTYSIKGQNIFVTYTSASSRVITELFAIATSADNAIEIAVTLNTVQNTIKSK